MQLSKANPVADELQSLTSAVWATFPQCGLRLAGQGLLRGQVGNAPHTHSLSLLVSPCPAIIIPNCLSVKQGMKPLMSALNDEASAP